MKVHTYMCTIVCVHLYYVYIVVVFCLDLFGSTVLTKQHTVYTYVLVFLLCIYNSGVLNREVPLYRTAYLSPKVSSIERFHCIEQLI